MFNWYVNGVQRNYEPRPITPARVKPATAVDPVDPDQSSDNPYDQLPPPPRRQPALIASQIMSSPVTTLPKTTDLSVVIELFRSRRFRHIPIITSSGAIVGIVSDRDVLRHFAAAFDPKGVQAGNHVLADVMKDRVLTAHPDTPLREIAKLMFEERIGCVPVLDDAHQIVGIVTRSDILRTVMNHAPLELWV